MSEKTEERFAKIERNMKFVRALEATLKSLEGKAGRLFDPGESYGIRTAVHQIRKVINEHVE